MNEPGTVAGRYQKLAQVRHPFLQRARDCATLTIPALLPPEGFSATSQLYTPFQSIGARGVNNLSSKMMLSLMPPNQAFFRYQVDDQTLEELTKREGARAEVEEALSRYERALVTEMETAMIRPVAAELFRQAIVTGNALLFAMKDGFRVYSLDKFVLVRDGTGNVLELIIKEQIAPAALPDNVRSAVVKPGDDVTKNVDLYTIAERIDGEWLIYQTIKDIQIEGSISVFPLNKCPFIAMRWSRVDGEDYGRGYVEEYLGDLKSLEGLSQAIVEGSAAAAKVLFFVKPNGQTKKADVSKAPNGEILAGNADDVTVLQLQKFNDFRVAKDTVDEISKRLSFAFLLNTSVQRAGERVTAEEIRYVAGEIEDALGGVYSLMSQEFQLPLVRIIQAKMEAAGRLQKLPKEIRPSIVTGIEALGRGHDLNKLDIFIGGLLQSMGAEAVGAYVNLPDLIKRRGNALGIDMKGLIKTPEEIAQANQQAQMQQLIESLGPNAVNALGGLAKEQVKQNGEGQAGNG